MTPLHPPVIQGIISSLKELDTWITREAFDRELAQIVHQGVRLHVVDTGVCMDTSYLKLNSTSRITNHMGLRMDPGTEYSYGVNYLYLQVPARASITPDTIAIDERGGSVTEVMSGIVKRNQHLFLEAAATINVRGHHMVLVEPNPELSSYGSTQAGHRVHPGSGEQRLGVWFTAHRSLDVRDLDYLVRLYMPV